MHNKLLLIVLTISLILTPPIAYAEDPPKGAADITAQDVGAAREDNARTGNLSGEVNSINAMVAGAYGLIVCPGIGVSCTTDVRGAHTYYQNSVLGQTTSTITMLYEQKPASTNQFIAYYGNKLGIVKSTNAQGIGFSGLSPLLRLWKAFRNVAYGFLILIMVVIGFMILFRMKLDPRTVISVQNALPRIIVTLILITFSYAIVGLLIDVMYLAIFLTLGVIRTVLPENAQFSQIVQNYTGGSLPDLIGAVWGPGQAAVDDITSAISSGLGSAISGIIALFGLATVAVSPILGGTALIGGGLGLVTGGNVLVWIIVTLALIFAFIRILFMLITAYIQIILSVIFGPLQLMFGAIPNTNAFGSWIRDLISNLAVFPITSIMLALANILTTYGATTNLWKPPGLGWTNLETGISGIIGLAMIFTIPNIAGAFREALKAKPAIPVGVSTIMSPFVSTGSTVWSMAYQWSFVKNAFGLGQKKPQ